MPYENTVVMNDYIHVDRRYRDTIIFEPLQPLAIISSVDGGLTTAEGFRLYFYVADDRSIYEIPQFGSGILYGERIGMIAEDGCIILNNSKRYAGDIYLCVTYVLADGDLEQREEKINWLVEGF